MDPLNFFILLQKLIQWFRDNNKKLLLDTKFQTNPDKQNGLQFLLEALFFDYLMHEYTTKEAPVVVKIVYREFPIDQPEPNPQLGVLLDALNGDDAEGIINIYHKNIATPVLANVADAINVISGIKWENRYYYKCLQDLISSIVNTFDPFGSSQILIVSFTCGCDNPTPHFLHLEGVIVGEGFHLNFQLRAAHRSEAHIIFVEEDDDYPFYNNN